jgi:hypothetical protein
MCGKSYQSAIAIALPAFITSFALPMRIYPIYCVILTSLLLFQCDIKIAHAGGGSDQNNATRSRHDSSQSVDPGDIELNHASCQDTCFFAIGRVRNGGRWEASAGVILQFNSPSNTQAQANRALIEAQAGNLEQETTTELADKLADAIEAGNQERANLLAIILAKRLGYEDYQRLLQDMKTK